MGTLREIAAATADSARPIFRTPHLTLSANDIAEGSCLAGDAEKLRDKNVLLVTKSQLATGLALLELDGIVRRMVLCTPELTPQQLARVAATAEADAIVCDGRSRSRHFSGLNSFPVVLPHKPRSHEAPRDRKTEWVLLTSGTTGAPKLVVHDLSTLTGAIGGHKVSAPPMVWGTFYDIRRYGGLQVFLRALAQGGSLVLPDADETMDDFICSVAAQGINFLSGTPSHWRRALMSPAARRLEPRHVRLSGEIVDQAILDRLRASYPGANVVHAFASTEAGVAFEVADAREGFRAIFLDRPDGAVELKLVDGTLRVRSPRVARRILGCDEPVVDLDGFVNTRDTIERRGERYYFGGRNDGTINIGGNKVHPEEIEAALNRHPQVAASRAKARRNPVMGALIEADVVLRDGIEPEAEKLGNEILAFCARVLPPHKRPIAVHVVSALELGAAGKLERNRA
ncbi:MAG: AMP-binding protein [Rhizomicrobium sp.]